MRGCLVALVSSDFTFDCSGTSVSTVNFLSDSCTLVNLTIYQTYPLYCFFVIIPFITSGGYLWSLNPYPHPIRRFLFSPSPPLSTLTLDLHCWLPPVTLPLWVFLSPFIFQSFCLTFWGLPGSISGLCSYLTKILSRICNVRMKLKLYDEVLWNFLISGWFFICILNVHLFLLVLFESWFSICLGFTLVNHLTDSVIPLDANFRFFFFPFHLGWWGNPFEFMSLLCGWECKMEFLVAGTIEFELMI